MDLPPDVCWCPRTSEFPVLRRSTRIRVTRVRNANSWTMTLLQMVTPEFLQSESGRIANRVPRSVQIAVDRSPECCDLQALCEPKDFRNLTDSLKFSLQNADILDVVQKSSERRHISRNADATRSDHRSRLRCHC